MAIECNEIINEILKLKDENACRKRKRMNMYHDEQTKNQVGKKQVKENQTWTCSLCIFYFLFFNIVSLYYSPLQYNFVTFDAHKYTHQRNWMLTKQTEVSY